MTDKNKEALEKLESWHIDQMNLENLETFDSCLKTIRTALEQNSVLVEALEDIAEETDDDGYTSDGHERLQWAAQQALKQIEDLK